MALVAIAGSGARLAEAQAAPAPAPSSTATVSQPFLTDPPKGSGPVVVRVRFHLRDINDLDDERETFEFQGVLTLRWRDARQAFDPAQAGTDEKVYQGAYQFNEVFTGWFPQLTLVNESGLYEKQGVVLRVRADGTLTLIETVDAVAEADLDLRRYPFDRQRLTAIFEVLGFDEGEVRLEAESVVLDPSRNDDRYVLVPQWSVQEVRTSVRDRRVPYAGSRGVSSAFVVSIDLRRKSFFMVRLVIVPLVLMVMLSWSVFWMDRSSLGDRINVSFIGILTVVAYQIVLSEILPRISYMTLMNGFLNFSFFVMCASAVVNLVVSSLDKQGRFDAGDRVDRRCRWIFPLIYFGLLALTVLAAFLIF